MLRKLIMFAITSGLAAKAWKAMTEQRKSPARTQPVAPQQPIAQWESEGGMPAGPLR